jgi:hypothetical protein
MVGILCPPFNSRCNSENWPFVVFLINYPPKQLIFTLRLTIHGGMRYAFLRTRDTFLMRMFCLFCGVLHLTLNGLRFTNHVINRNGLFVFWCLTLYALRFTLHGYRRTVEGWWWMRFLKGKNKWENSTTSPGSYRVFSGELETIIHEINEAIAAWWSGRLNPFTPLEIMPRCRAAGLHSK